MGKQYLHLSTVKALHASQQNSTHGDVILPNVLESPTLKGAYRKLAPHDEAHLQLVISRQQGLQLLVADRRRLVGARRLEQISDDDLRTLGSCGLNANRVAAENTGVTAIIFDFRASAGTLPRTIDGERRWGLSERRAIRQGGRHLIGVTIASDVTGKPGVRTRRPS